MPIYEFYCRSCHTLYNFFSRSVNTEKVPFCPACKDVKLERQMSVFASITPGKGGEEGDMPSFDEAKMERAMAMLAGEAERIDENDPRQAADLMRKLSEAAGLKMGTEMEEALARLERGEDPDAVEAEMGDLLEGEEPFLSGEKKKGGGRRGAPRVDETLYEL